MSANSYLRLLTAGGGAGAWRALAAVSCRRPKRAEYHAGSPNVCEADAETEYSDPHSLFSTTNFGGELE